MKKTTIARLLASFLPAVLPSFAVRDAGLASHTDSGVMIAEARVVLIPGAADATQTTPAPH